MLIWLFAMVATIALLALGVWGMQRLYGTPGRCSVQTGTAAREIAAAPTDRSHSVRLWVDDGAPCIDGEVLP